MHPRPGVAEIGCTVRGGDDDGHRARGGRLLRRAGLAMDDVAAWLAAAPHERRLPRAIATSSRGSGALGGALREHLPPKPERGAAEAERPHPSCIACRDARERFLAAHAGALYRALTADRRASSASRIWSMTRRASAGPRADARRCRARERAAAARQGRHRDRPGHFALARPRRSRGGRASLPRDAAAAAGVAERAPNSRATGASISAPRASSGAARRRT